MSKFSDSLKAIRIKSEKTQRDVSEYLGVNLRTYQYYEEGRSEPSIPAREKRADFFMVSLDELVNRDGTGRGSQSSDGKPLFSESPCGCFDTSKNSKALMGDFPNSLKQMRKNSSKKQREVADYLDVNIRTYQNYESGQLEPSIIRLIQLANFFMVSLDELVAREWIGYDCLSPSVGGKPSLENESPARLDTSAIGQGFMSDSFDSLKRLRKGSGKTQRETAEYLGVDIRTYQYYESGQLEPSITRLIQLANFFMVSLDELVGRDWIGECPLGPTRMETLLEKGASTPALYIRGENNL